MPDIIKTCTNCHQNFVYSEYEQKMDSNKGLPPREYCLICNSLKNQEKIRPPKPSKS